MSDIFDHESDAWDSYEDYYNDGDGDGPRMKTRPVCRRCALVCTWHHTGERWRLMGPDGRLHSCTAPASVDDFEDVS